MDLQPCPKCGGNDLEVKQDVFWTARCKTCGHESRPATTAISARNNWNLEASRQK